MIKVPRMVIVRVFDFEAEAWRARRMTSQRAARLLPFLQRRFGSSHVVAVTSNDVDVTHRLIIDYCQCETREVNFWPITS